MKRSKGAPATRLGAERQRVAASERAEPLRRRLLIRLGEGDAVPSVLADDVGSSREQVSRKLKELREAGLVTFDKEVDDRRRSRHSLTSEGRSELGRYLAFGKAEDPLPKVSDEEKVAFLTEALEGAKTLRRRSNRLREASERFEDIRSQALEIGASDLALRALAELTITQRQARQVEKRDRSLETMKSIAFGAGDFESRLVYPAVAHLEYERGKGGELGETDTAALARHLFASTSLFEALTEERSKAETKVWGSHRAWSVVSLAENYREQSRYEDALQYGSSALRLFEELGDDYGHTRCLLLFGVCLRLLQRFDVAWICLEQAYALADARSNGFERAMVDCLVQMGEVRRCQSSTGEARDLLVEACERAERLEMTIARAFATSALAAGEFQDEALDRAQTVLREAQKMFKKGRHVEGVALNARRQATVARHLSAQGIAPSDDEVKSLIALSEKNYRFLGSPAGVAACEIERGWMRTISPACGDVDEVVDRLNLMLGDTDERRPIEGDPWVPKVLRAFSREVGGPLEKQTKELLTTSNRRIEQEGETGVKSVSEVAEGLDQGTPRPAHRSVAEMAGESRRRKAPPELTAA
jgi:DNA-binding MarR family transcriptional regulator